MKKLILSDCDGVILDWEKHFHDWLKSKGHKKIHTYNSRSKQNYEYFSFMESRQLVYQFNNSVWMSNMPPFRDAVSGISKLVSAGYKFHIITASGDNNQFSIDARLRNLTQLFGEDFIHDFTATDIEDENSKVPVLSQYKDSGLIWLEDKPKNAEIGLELGLRSILFEHPHNLEYRTNSGIESVSNWHELCEKILS